ncbi:hypothetical protein B0H16DRAFT_1550907 [Mycena metata]|uniref:MFS general substrate transporter n=1 Tax=Mycena metata TaxID=1033252 RepID=A0AAD7ISN2_9AGAR|nr:hypothetical protein B0H16DRAFT_1550907 [Mycena metata]
MATDQPTETEPLLARSDPIPPNEREEDSPKLPKLLSVVAVASICRGISMYSRYESFRYSPQAWHTAWVAFPGLTIDMELWSTWASLVVSFASVGWWSAFSDRRGRKPVLFVSLLGPVVLDFIFLTIAKSSLHDDAISVGLIIEGLLGGFPTFAAVIHAYASDLSLSMLSRTVMFGTIQAAMFIFFIVGGYFGVLADRASDLLGLRHGQNLAFSLGIILASANLTYVYSALPESFAPPTIEDPPVPPAANSTLKYIFAPFSTFLRKGPSRRQIFFLATSTFFYSWTLALGPRLVKSTADAGFFSFLPRWLLIIIPNIAALLTWLCVIPAFASLVKRTYGDTETSDRLLAKSLAQNSILLAALCTLGILIFGGVRSSPLYALFFSLYPLTAGALPALYALAASYWVALDRSAELGALFGALSIWVSWGEYMSYSTFNWSYITWGLQWSSFFLIVSLLFLVPDGPPRRAGALVVDQTDDAVV